jgi:hypothetical protein
MLEIIISLLDHLKPNTRSCPLYFSEPNPDERFEGKGEEEARSPNVVRDILKDYTNNLLPLATRFDDIIDGQSSQVLKLSQFM